MFGRNVEDLHDIPWTNACICHGCMCVEGGIALAAATALFHGIDPKTSFLISKDIINNMLGIFPLHSMNLCEIYCVTSVDLGVCL